MLVKSSLNAGIVGFRVFRGQTGKCFGDLRKEWTQRNSYLLNPKAHYTTASKIPVCYYEEIKDLPNHPEKLLIDVREPSELKETGQIPTSINIPLKAVKEELSDNTKAEIFQKKYGRSKPLKNTELIFHCRIGKRSATASTTAINLGYTDVKNYEGSWLDWAEREGLPKG